MGKQFKSLFQLYFVTYALKMGGTPGHIMKLCTHGLAYTMCASSHTHKHTHTPGYFWVDKNIILYKGLPIHHLLYQAAGSE